MFTLKRALCTALVAVSGSNFAGALVFKERAMDSIASDLESLVSQGAVSTTAPERWSTYDAPKPQVVVTAVTEKDVAATVSCLI